MKNFRKSKLFVLATVLTIVFGAFAVSSADAGCGFGGGFGGGIYGGGFGGYGYAGHYAPGFGHIAPVYGHTGFYAPAYLAAPGCGGLYW